MTLLTEIGIIVSVLVTYSCSLYTSVFDDGVPAHDQPEHANSARSSSAYEHLILNVGLFKFSTSNEPLTFVEHSQCIVYGSIDSSSSNGTSSMDTSWAEQTLSMARPAQAWAVAAPALAMLGLMLIGVEVFRPHIGLLSWVGVADGSSVSLPKVLSTLHLALAGISQTVGMLSFDGEQAW